MLHVNAARLAAGGGAWTPADLTNLYVWLDATDASTFTYSSSTIVSTWADKSGNGFDATTTSGSPNRNVTINSLDAVAFSSAYMTIANPSLSQPLWIWSAWRQTSLAADNDMIAQASPLVVLRMEFAGANRLIYAGATGLQPGAKFANDTNYVWGAFMSGTSSYERLNGVASSTANAGTDGLTSGGVLICKQGNGGGLYGAYMGEVILTGSMTSDEITSMETYLARWGTI